MLLSFQFNFKHIIDRLVDKINSHVRIEHYEVSKSGNIYEVLKGGRHCSYRWRKHDIRSIYHAMAAM